MLQTPESSERLSRAILSLEGLSTGDAFGECFFLPKSEFGPKLENRILTPSPWPVTDDTMMAVSVVESLRLHGQIIQDWLAGHFAQMYDPLRGYGAAMHGLLTRIRQRGGQSWRREAAALFGGMGSYGNGSAMRVAPLGGYFADDLEAVIEQARRSASPTHAHPEAVAGAIAIALGAAIAWRTRAAKAPAETDFLEEIRSLTPDSAVRAGIEKALRLPETTTAEQAAIALGNGWQITAMDTVPFVLWSAARSLDNYKEALWQTVGVGGDKDTTCAMVGGIVVLRTGLAGIPGEWRRRREPLSLLFASASSLNVL